MFYLKLILIDADLTALLIILNVYKNVKANILLIGNLATG